MKPIISIFILVFAFGLSVFGQTDIAACPTIDVQGGGVWQPEEPMSFSAIVGGDAKGLKIEYLWTVSGGKITEGQGASSIKVEKIEIKGLGNINVTATVEVKGFPSNCANTASETAGIIIHYRNVLFDEFGKPREAEVSTRIENLFLRLAEEPGSQAYFINYGTEREIAGRETQLLRVIRLSKLDLKRVTIINGGANYRSAGVFTRVWIVPPGVEPPTPDMD
jgi:hypothetical protein